MDSSLSHGAGCGGGNVHILVVSLTDNSEKDANTQTTNPMEERLIIATHIMTPIEENGCVLNCSTVDGTGVW